MLRLPRLRSLSALRCPLCPPLSTTLSTSATPPRPLDGVRVLELEGLAAAPFCGRILADFGADVVRVDRNDRPDPYGTLSLAHGKRSVVLDLKDTDDAEQLRELADNADVLIEPYRPGVMERLNLGPDELRARNPRLVYARLTVRH